MRWRRSNGARVGDTFMSLIHAAEMCGANAFECLVALQSHDEQVADGPGAWMPWNYTVVPAALAPGTEPIA